MTQIIVNSDIAFQSAIGEFRDLYSKHRYVKLTMVTGKHRSLDQNAIGHAWYEQLARELREDDAMGWKSYCKLHHGVPILRQENDEFRAQYDAVIKGLTYEQKLIAMRMLPVTSLMTKEQKSKYLEQIHNDFLPKGVRLEFPESA